LNPSAKFGVCPRSIPGKAERNNAIDQRWIGVRMSEQQWYYELLTEEFGPIPVSEI
jgi:hypothetical protein